jgi:hypothetical protein
MIRDYEAAGFFSHGYQTCSTRRTDSYSRS